LPEEHPLAPLAAHIIRTAVLGETYVDSIAEKGSNLHILLSGYARMEHRCRPAWWVIFRATLAVVFDRADSVNWREVDKAMKAWGEAIEGN
jgi:hypothetical protein